MKVASAQIFTAGNGQKFGLVSLEGSKQVVVFKWSEPCWRGCVEFNDWESSGLWPGEATPEIADALRKAEYPALDTD